MAITKFMTLASVLVLSVVPTLAAPGSYPSVCNHRLPTSCPKIGNAISAVKKIHTSSAFCSSYIHLTKSTVTSTCTVTAATTVAGTTVTGTTVVTEPLSVAPTVTLPPVIASTVTSTITDSVTTVTTCSTILEKRAAAAAAVLPQCVTGYPSKSISDACSCLCLPTSTTTVHTTVTVHPTATQLTGVVTTITTVPVSTPTVTPTLTPSTTIHVTGTSTVESCPAQTPDSSCGNKGVQWAYYQSPFGDNAPPQSNYDQFDPSYFKNSDPVVFGTTGSAGGLSGPSASAGQTTTIYGQSVECSFFALNLRGYLFWPTSGDYTVTFSSVDDIVYVWAGPVAYSGWNNENALIRYSYNDARQGPKSATISTVGGTYTPFRVMFGQAQMDYGFSLQVKAPDGTVILDASSSTSDYLVQFACPNSLSPAPQYPPFGSET